MTDDYIKINIIDHIIENHAVTVVAVNQYQVNTHFHNINVLIPVIGIDRVHILDRRIIGETRHRDNATVYVAAIHVTN